MNDIAPLVITEPADLRAAWANVRDRVSAIAERCKEPWIAEDVFHEILIGNAYLWATADRSAFVVLQIHASAYQRDLYIWIGCENTLAHARDYWPQLVDIRDEAHCNRITFDSPRRWNRALPNLKVRYLYSYEE